MISAKSSTTTASKISSVVLWVLSWVICFGSFSAVYSQNSFAFLNIPTNARQAALGGVNISLSDKDINLVAQNPAVLDSSQQNQIGLNYSPYLAQSNYLSLNYSPKWKGNWAFSIQNISYGNFVGRDDLGNLTNDFSANDFSVGVSHTKKVQNISFGIRAKVVASVLESYSSFAILTDWGGTFKHPKKDLSFGILAKNIGFTLKNYSAEKAEIPFDFQVGMSFKPQFMPIRFSISAHTLYRFDIVYNNPKINFEFDQQGNKIPIKTPFSEKIFRHFVIGAEVLIHQNFNLLLGYNHQLRKEMQLNQIGTLAGFSAGGIFKSKKINLSFSRQFFALRGASYFTLNYFIRNS